MSKQILEGVKILDFSTMIAAPTAAVFLAEFGAEVIKVESDGGDAMRVAGMNKDGVMLYPKLLNRNKKCITLDMHHESAVEQFYRLAEWADVIITNFRPSALKKFKVDYEDIIKVNPQIVYMHFSAYGRTGPYANNPGYARVAEAYSGLTYITGFPDRAPVLSGNWIVDGIGGIHAAYSTMLALYHKEKTGEGQLVDVGLYEPLFRILEELPMNYSANGVVKERNGNMQSQVVPNNMYLTKDKVWVVLPVNGRMFERLVAAMGREDLLDDPRYNTMAGRVENRQLVDSTVAEWIASLDRDEVNAKLDQYDVAHGPVNSIQDIFEDKHMWERGSLVNIYDEQLKMNLTEPGVIPKMSKTPGEIKWSGPEQGAHNDEIFKGLLGLSDEEYEKLKRSGAI